MIRKELKIKNRLKQKNIDYNPFRHVYFTLLGLGDSNYSKYQGNPRWVWDSLIQLGARSWYKRGEADEATSLELVVEPWIEGLCEEFEK